MENAGYQVLVDDETRACKVAFQLAHEWDGKEFEDEPEEVLINSPPYSHRIGGNREYGFARHNSASLSSNNTFQDTFTDTTVRHANSLGSYGGGEISNFFSKPLVSGGFDNRNATSLVSLIRDNNELWEELQRDIEYVRAAGGAYGYWF